MAQPFQLPFGLSKVIRPISPSLAKTRFKSNLFALALFSLRNLFPPYTSIRGGIVRLGDTLLQGRKGREGSWTDVALYAIETLILIILLWNILEAGISIQYPSTYAPPQPRGMVMTPSRISSPLTRAYSPSPSTPSQQSQQSLTQSSYRPSPSNTNTNAIQTPTRNALASSTNNSTKPATPLSSSTAKIFNLSPAANASPRSTGLFFDQPSSASRGNPVAPTTTGTGGTTADGFVLVDREEKEWIENVRKGVRGKGGRVGI